MKNGKGYFTYSKDDHPSMPISAKQHVTGCHRGDDGLEMMMLREIKKQGLSPELAKEARKIAASFGTKPQNG